MGANMNWLLNLPPFEGYLIAIPAIMVGSILLVGAIVLLFELSAQRRRATSGAAEAHSNYTFAAVASVFASRPASRL